MSDTAFSFQLAEIERAMQRRAVMADSRRHSGGKYPVYGTPKPRRVNSSGENGFRRQRMVPQQPPLPQQQQQQQQYYRQYDQHAYYEPSRPASQPALNTHHSQTGLTTQFLDSLLAQQVARSQTPTLTTSGAGFFDLGVSTSRVGTPGAPLSPVGGGNFGANHGTTNPGANNNNHSSFDSFASLNSQFGELNLSASSPQLSSPIPNQLQPHQLMNYIFKESSAATTSSSHNIKSGLGSIDTNLSLNINSLNNTTTNGLMSNTVTATTPNNNNTNTNALGGNISSSFSLSGNSTPSLTTPTTAIGSINNFSSLSGNSNNTNTNNGASLSGFSAFGSSSLPLAIGNTNSLVSLNGLTLRGNSLESSFGGSNVVPVSVGVGSIGSSTIDLTQHDTKAGKNNINHHKEMVDPLESIWKRSSAAGSNTDLGLNGGYIGQDIGGYF